MNIRNKISLGIAFLVYATAPFARGSGVTIITHGYAGNVDGWVTGMANQITNYHNFPGQQYSILKLALTFDGNNYFYQWTLVQGSPPTATDSGEIIVKLDWSQIAGGLSAPYNESTYDVAMVASWVLKQTNAIFGGHALAEFPLHLIGHSRGGSLVSEMSLWLGADGIWVDHLTTLDPHPLNNDGFSDPPLVIDAPVRTYLNVLYHDNYWQNLGDGLIVPNGEPVVGSYQRQLYNLAGGYSSSHSDVHLWYHATVDERNPANDTEAQISNSEFNTWYVAYEQYGFTAGFDRSLIGGGDRTSPDRPLGAGFPAIQDGLNQAWDFGVGQTGNRNSLPSNNGFWPNIIKFDILGSHTVPMGNSISNKYFFQFGQSAATNATVQVCLDGNSNPFDGNGGLAFQQVETGTGTNVVRSRIVSFPATNTPGQYYIFAKVTAGGRTRYLQAPGKITITPPPDLTPPFVAITNPPSPRTYTNAQMVTISANATDNVAVVNVEFYDGSLLRGSDSLVPFTYDSR